MEGQRLLYNLAAENLLSFGPDGASIELQPLNLLIGPNGSGKSNLIEVLRLLRSLMSDLPGMLSSGGGFSEYLWKGADAGNSATIRTRLRTAVPGDGLLAHSVMFSATELRSVERPYIAFECVEDAGEGTAAPQWYFMSESAQPRIRVRDDVVPLSRYDLRRSVLAQLRDPDRYPQLSDLGDRYRSIAIYSDWSFGRDCPVRRPQRAGEPYAVLESDAHNLGAVIERLLNNSAVQRAMTHELTTFCERFTGYKFKELEGSVELRLEERGLRSEVPVSRLSDGTLRFLCLQAILHDPQPPPLVCLEEPELGLHPDILPTIARMLRDAAKRTQLIVTTHSDLLVSQFDDLPEAIVVCERLPGGTQMRRLPPASDADREEDLPLGERWLSGQIGGTRW